MAFVGTSDWRFRVKISPPISKIAKMFGESAKEFSDYTPAWPGVFRKVMTGISRVISSKGAAIGKPWPELKDKYYLARKARKGASRLDLYFSGRLRESIGLVKMGKKYIKVGSSVPYAVATQYGFGLRNVSHKFNKGVPTSRIFIALDEKAKADASEELNIQANAILSRLASKINTDKSAA